MKKIIIIGLCFFAVMPKLHAQSAEYTEGYNAGYENTPPPTGMSDDYVAGWQAGQLAEQAKAPETEPMQEQPSDSSDQNSSE